MLAGFHRLYLVCLTALGGCGSVEVSVPPVTGGQPARALVAVGYDQEKALAKVAHQKPTVRRSPDGLFYVQALVNKVPVIFVVDSGSSIVILNKADADRAGVKRDAHGTQLQTAGGITNMRRAVIDEVSVADHRLDQIDAAVVDDTMGVSLLGQSALSQLDAVSFSGDTLELR